MPRGQVLCSFIEGDEEGEAVILVDDHELGVAEFGGLLKVYAG